MARDPSALAAQCDRLRALHVPSTPLLLPNAWDAATARAVVAAGFPVVATTSGGVANALGYDDHEGAPAAEMLAAAGRIARAVDVPVTVDAESGYGLEPAELVAALAEAGAAGCNLEDTDHAADAVRDRDEHATWLRAVRTAADERGYPLVINARIDVFLAGLGRAGDGRPVLEGAQGDLVDEALDRARAYVEAGADCVYPIALWEREAVVAFLARAPAPVNLLPSPQSPPPAELAALGAARLSWASFLFRTALERYGEALAEIAALR
ncbi:MAG TPA: isocitrate lyase/phosphoenolpyruvate mutase family protein [Acidimicrobiales bacterium]